MKMNGGKICNMIHGLKPMLLMVAVQTAAAGVNVFYKLAANDGMTLSILIAYRLIFSAALLVPLAFFLERGQRPKMTWMTIIQAFGCGLFGSSLAQNLYLKALTLTSATFVSAIFNLIPAITFLLAVCFRMEVLGWKTKPGAAKILGTILGVGGAMLLTLYKGAELHLWKVNVDLLKNQHNASNVQPSTKLGGGFLGPVLAIFSSISYSTWLILQAKMTKTYPCPYSVTALTLTMGAIQAFVFVLCTDRDWSNWKLGWDIRLATVTYSGMLGSGLAFTIITWCVQMRGPLFVSSFNPLMLILVAILASLILNETLHLGSVLGAILIIAGLYIVLWGKSKEAKKAVQLRPITESNVGTGDVESLHSSYDVVAADTGSKHSSTPSGSTSGESRHGIDVVAPYI